MQKCTLKVCESLHYLYFIVSIYKVRRCFKFKVIWEMGWIWRSHWRGRDNMTRYSRFFPCCGVGTFHTYLHFILWYNVYLSLSIGIYVLYNIFKHAGGEPRCIHSNSPKGWGLRQFSTRTGAALRYFLFGVSFTFGRQTSYFWSAKGSGRQNVAYTGCPFNLS